MNQAMHLSRERTRIASERTLMAWVRTAVSLIGFGFSIPKFFSFLAASEPLKGALGVSPRVLGILLIALGTLGVLGGLVEHARLLHSIQSGMRPRPLASVAVFTATLMGLVGLVALFNVLSM